MSLPSEEYFVAMMESVWGMCEDEGETVTKEQIKHLTKTMRHKLLDFANGATEELVLKNILASVALDVKDIKVICDFSDGSVAIEEGIEQVV